MSKLLQKNAVSKKAAEQKNLPKKTKHRFRLVHIQNEFFSHRKVLKNTKCTLEVHRAGIKLSGDFYEGLKHISVLSKEIRSIELIRGKETVDTFYLSPIHILTKIGLPNYVARHFRFHPTEYKIAQTKICIETLEQQLVLISSGYRFERLLRSFKRMDLGEKLSIKRKASIDLSDFRDIIPDSQRTFYN